MAARDGALRVDVRAVSPPGHAQRSTEDSERGQPDGERSQPDDSCPAPDEILVDRVRAGELGAFDELYRRYFPRVFHFVARRLRNRSDAEETVQEVFFNIFASIDSFRGEAPFGAWVFGLARRTVSSRFKKRMPLLVPLLEDDGDGAFHAATHDPDPHQLYECGERLARLEGAVANELSEEQRQLFELHHLEHRSIQEIAGLLSKSEDAVKSHLYRARRVLLAR
jgi:RNA polymerase sigma-70 factor, ECF subfamily